MHRPGADRRGGVSARAAAGSASVRPAPSAGAMALVVAAMLVALVPLLVIAGPSRLVCDRAWAELHRYQDRRAALSVAAARCRVTADPAACRAARAWGGAPPAYEIEERREAQQCERQLARLQDWGLRDGTGWSGLDPRAAGVLRWFALAACVAGAGAALRSVVRARLRTGRIAAGVAMLQLGFGALVGAGLPPPLPVEEDRPSG